jgi:hypothetical protein
MRPLIYIFLFLFTLIFLTGTTSAQIKTKANPAVIITYYEYDRYDKDGNSYKSIEAPTTELRYECPICKGAAVLNKRENRTGVPVMVTCWRCNGKGYLVSYSGKQK